MRDLESFYQRWRAAEASARALCYHPLTISIPIVDLPAQFDSIREEIHAAVRRVFESQRFILGVEVEALENAIASLTGTRYAIGCASGSDAIMLAIAALLPPRRSPGPAAPN